MKKTKKLLALFLAVCSIMLMSSSTFAAEQETAGEPAITAEIAGYIAEFFIADNIENPELSWNENTAVSEVVEMVDADGNASAYSVELKTAGQDSGYIVVSAYPGGNNNPVIEYADESEPVYAEMDAEAEEAIVYCGALDYFVEDANGDYIAATGETVEAEEVQALSDEYLETVETGSAIMTMSSAAVDWNQFITDPVAYAKAVYGGEYKCVEYNNNLEKYCSFIIMNDNPYPNGIYENHCGPTAVANIIQIVGKQRNISSITSKSSEEIFRKALDDGGNSGYYHYQKGTNHSEKLIEECWKRGYGITVDSQLKAANYTNIKNEINNNRPVYLKLLKNPMYNQQNEIQHWGNHAVVGYAYTRFLNITAGYYKSFVKIADGWARSGRYLDIYVTDYGNRCELYTSF